MANPFLVQSVVNEGTNPPNTQVRGLTTAFPSKTTAGNVIATFGTFSDFAGIHTDGGALDGQGNTYTRLTQANTNPSNGAASVDLCIATGIVGDTATAETVTTQFTSSGDVEDYQAAVIMELGGVNTTTPLIGYSSQAQNALAPGTNNVVSGLITVSSAQLPALLVGIAMNSSVAGSHPLPTAGSGMTSLNAALWGFYTGTSLAAMATQYITVAGSYQATFNQASSAAEDMACVAFILQGLTAILAPTLMGQTVL